MYSAGFTFWLDQGVSSSYKADADNSGLFDIWPAAGTGVGEAASISMSRKSSGITTSLKLDTYSDGSTTSDAPLDVKVGGSTSYYCIYANARIYSGGGFYPTSDERCKSDINDVNVLDAVKNLRVKKYHLDDRKIAQIRREKEIEKNLRENNAATADIIVPPEPEIENYNPCKSIGVMAADFNAAFGIGGGETETYNLSDGIGVALRAIQELAEIVDEQAAEIAELRAALNLPEKQKKQVSAEFTAEEIEKAADKHVKAAYDNIMQELKQ